MSKFSYSMPDNEAILSFKKTLSGTGGGIGSFAILKDNGNKFVVGAPGISVNVEFKSGICETKASLFGKVYLASIDNIIEQIEGFTKI